MKLSKIGSLLKRDKSIYLYNDLPNNMQWIGNGAAAYPIIGMPPMTEDNICTMFDITTKQKQEYFIRVDTLPERLCFKDTDPAENELAESDLLIVKSGRELQPLETQNGLAFLDMDYLKPIGTEDYIKLFERPTQRGGVYFAVKVGLNLQAIIMPFNPVSTAFVRQMENMACQCKNALVIQELAKAANKKEQSALQDDLEDCES